MLAANVPGLDPTAAEALARWEQAVEDVLPCRLVDVLHSCDAIAEAGRDLSAWVSRGRNVVKSRRVEVESGPGLDGLGAAEVGAWLGLGVGNWWAGLGVELPGPSAQRRRASKGKQGTL